jgi:site-specific DNA recombinase
MKLIGYVRVSQVRGRDGDSFQAPKQQEDAIKAYAKAHGHEVVGWKTDLDESGGKASRPEFDLALDAIVRGEADGLIVAKLNRFMRSLPDAFKVIERLTEAGKELISVADNFDSSTPMGRFARDLVLRLGQLELELITESWDSARMNAVERGIHVASRAPTGYQRRDTHPKTGKPAGPLVKDPATARYVHDLFLRRASGAGWTALADFLTEKGVVSPYGNSSWTASATAQIIRNPVYKGEARAGRHVNLTAHEKIVTHAEWDAAQLDFIVPNGRTKDALLLSGLVRCSGCRYLVKPDVMTARGESLGLYRCRKRHAAGECTHPVSILSRVIEPHVEQAFLDALGPNGPIAVASVSSAEIEDAQRQVDEAERELIAYNEAVAAADVDPAVLRAGIEVRAKRLDRARSDLAQLRRSAGVGTLPAPRELLQAWPSLETAEKREILAAAIDAVVVWPARGSGKPVPPEERVSIYWRGEGPQNLPRRGRRVPLEPWSA